MSEPASPTAAKSAQKEAALALPPLDALWFESPAAGARVGRSLDQGNVEDALQVMFSSYYATGGIPASLLTAARAQRIVDGAVAHVARIAENQQAMLHAFYLIKVGGARLPILLKLDQIFTEARLRVIEEGDVVVLLAKVEHDTEAYKPLLNRPETWRRFLALLRGKRAAILADSRARLSLSHLFAYKVISDEHVSELAEALFGLRVRSTSLMDRLGDALTSAAGLDGGAANRTVSAEMLGSAAGAASVVPDGHMSLLASVKVEAITSKPGDVATGFYSPAQNSIVFDPRYEGTATMIHELGHALDDRLGNPSRRREIFGWRELHDADEMASAADLGSLRGRAPRLAQAIHAAYRALFAGGRGWMQLLRVDAKDSVSAREVEAFRQHPAFLAGAAADDTADNETPAHQALTPSEYVLFHGYYGRAFALQRSHHDAYVKAHRMRALYAPAECFADVYTAWYASENGEAPILPPTVAAYFRSTVEPFGKNGGAKVG